MFKVVLWSLVIMHMAGAVTEAPLAEAEGTHSRLQQTLVQEEAALKKRKSSFLRALEENALKLKEILEKKEAKKQRNPNKIIPLLDDVLQALYRPFEDEMWMRSLFSEALCAKWFAIEDALVLNSKERHYLQPRMEAELDTLTTEMMAKRRHLTDQFGELGLYLGQPDKREALLRRGDVLLRKFIDRPKRASDEEVLAAFMPLEGMTLAQKHLRMYEAITDLNEAHGKLQTANQSDLIQKIKEQRAHVEEGGQIGKMMMYRLRFYVEALMFFYKGDLDAFNDSKRGVAHLWHNLSKRADEFKDLEIVVEGQDQGDEAGLTLLRFFGDYRKTYNRIRDEIKSNLAKIRSDAKQKASKKESVAFKLLAHPMETVDLEKAFKRMEDGEHDRLIQIVALEKKLSDLTGGLTVSAIKEKEVEANKAAKDFEVAFNGVVQSYEASMKDQKTLL